MLGGMVYGLPLSKSIISDVSTSGWSALSYTKQSMINPQNNERVTRQARQMATDVFLFSLYHLTIPISSEFLILFLFLQFFLTKFVITTKLILMKKPSNLKVNTFEPTWDFIRSSSEDH